MGKKSLLLVVALLLVRISATATSTINSRTSILIDSREPEPIQKAARDLASDMQKVFGTPVPWVSQRSAASATTICIAFSHNLPKGVTRPDGWELLKLQAVANPWLGSPVQNAIVLTGSDVLGVVYAIYQFSQQFLGVDPLYWWTDNPPARRASVTIPEGFSEREGPPTFRYRGWFMNDEDLLTGWRPGTRDGTGISLKTWDRIFEVLLRLKGNMIIPGTYIFPWEPQIRAAAARGLMIAQHHDEPMGVNVYQWPNNVPYALPFLQKAWKCTVAEYPRNVDVIWTVGVRGRYDHPFWLDVPGVPNTPAGRARFIEKAIGEQMKIVKQEWPHPHPQFIWNSWMEGSGLMRSGVLKIPRGVTLVWADDGGGLIQDGGLIGKGEGVYYHTAVIGGNANNFTERVPVTRIQRQLGRAARAGATQYLLLNPSDIRPVVMTTRAVMNLAWDARPWVAQNHDEAMRYLAGWSREEFGAPATPLVVKYYQAFFHVSARYGAKADDILADAFYQDLGRDLLVHLMLGLYSPWRSSNLQRFQADYPDYQQYASHLREICQEAEPRWRHVAQLAHQAQPLILPARRDFYQAEVLTELELHLHSNLMLVDLANAVLSNSPSAKLASVNAAIRELQQILTALRAADYGKWRGFYTKGDWFVDIPLTLALAEVERDKFEGRSLSVAQRAVLKNVEYNLNHNTSAVFKKIKAYQDGQKVRIFNCAAPAQRRRDAN